MVEPAAVEVRDALDELVNQFADPMSFLRELIQNAIDAGSEEVEVTVRREGSGDAGATVVHIDDWGEGMTREIIDKRLTRLFSSAKDGDMTKIGKFGIGFVSVFAIEPEAVCVDTAREGESWRVLFDAERRFKLIRRDEPVDGTKIRIIKKTSHEEHDEIAKRCRRVLDYWCKHVQTDIRCDGELIRQPFALPDATASVEHDDGFSHIVVGHQATGGSFAGFYNSGLTLIESEDPELPGIAYKVSSPHLEHTLTRDAVIRDEGYERVMTQVRTQLAGPLCDRVLTELGEHWDGSRWAGEASRLTGLLRAVSRHAVMGHLGSERDHAVVLHSPSGTALTLRALRGRHRDDEILIAVERSHLTDALEERGSTVVAAPIDAAAAVALRDCLGVLTKEVALHALNERYCLPVISPAATPGGALARAVQRVLSDEGLKVGAVGFASFSYPESGIADRVAVAQPKLGAIAPVAEAVSLSRGFFSRSRSITVNTAHPAVASLLTVAQHEPELAGYLLVKQFMLGHQLDAELDTRLMQASVVARWQRSTT